MRRLLVVGAVVAAAVAALAVVAVVRSGGSGDETVQTVAGHEITREDLELAVEHFHEEADREGRPFPAKGTSGYKTVERIALGLLIDQAASQAAAARLGVRVSEAQVRARTASSGEGEEGGDVRVKAEAVFARATTRTQLAKEGVARRLTVGLTVPRGRQSFFLGESSLVLPDSSGPRARRAGKIGGQYTPIHAKCNLLHFESEIGSLEASRLTNQSENKE